MKTGGTITTRLQGGLGNQLFQYAVGRAISIRFGRELLLDARLIQREAPARHYDLGVFKIREQHVAGLPCWCVRWLCSIRFGRLFKVLCPLAWNYRLLQDRESGFDASVFEPHAGPLVLQGYWQSYKYFQEHRELLQREFELKTEPDALNQTMLNEIESGNSVAVHVRRGDYVSSALANSIHGTCGPEYYSTAAALLGRKVSEPRFYVFTDDPAWARQNLALPGPMRFVDHNLGKRDCEDLRLMSRCKHFIIANSSFSWWGAWLAQNRGKVVMAPARWFVQDHYPPEDRIPADWIRL